MGKDQFSVAENGLWSFANPTATAKDPLERPSKRLRSQWQPLCNNTRISCLCCRNQTPFVLSFDFPSDGFAVVSACQYSYPHSLEAAVKCNSVKWHLFIFTTFLLHLVYAVTPLERSALVGSAGEGGKRTLPVSAEECCATAADLLEGKT